MSTLCTISYATNNATLGALYASNPTLVTQLLASATTAIQRETKRTLFQGTYTEYVSGGNYPYDQIFLKEFPVTAITRVATNPTPVLTVINSDSFTNQRATVATTSSGITLTTVASGITTTTNLSGTSYVTLQSLATAITGTGSGWSATVLGPYGLYPSADLRQLQGAYTALNGGANLELFLEEVTGAFTLMDNYDNGWGRNYGWRLDDSAGILFGRFPRGQLNVRVDYTGGFATIPDDLQEACLQLVLDFYNAQNANQSLRSERVGPYAYELNAMASYMSPKVRAICAKYSDTGKLNLHR